MRVRSFRSILDECLTALQRGESLDACLSRYPRQADRLRPLLSISERVRRVPPAAPRPLTQGISWDRVRQRDSLPDSRLYPVKLATEDARVWFTFDSTHKAEILLDQSNERTQEITTMVGQGKQVPSNVLSALRDRNDRAFGILNDHPGNNDVLNRARLEAETQEKLLIALWPDVEDSARTEYTRAVADVHNSRRPSTDVVEAVQPEELSGGVLNISGVAQKVSDGVWNVGGSEVRVDEKTFGSEQLEAGATANFVVARSASG